MSRTLAAVAAFALVFAIVAGMANASHGDEPTAQGVAAQVAALPTTDPRHYDENGNGSIEILDATIWLKGFRANFGQYVAPPDPCVHIYRTPVAGYAIQIGAPAEHPIFQGDVRLVPCLP